MNPGTSDAIEDSAAKTPGRHTENLVQRFRCAWTAADPSGPRPTIQDYLIEVPAPERPALLRQLLAVELQYLQTQGELPSPHDYVRQFPEAASLIQLVFEHLRNGATLPPPPGQTQPSRATTQRATEPPATVDYVPSTDPDPTLPKVRRDNDTERQPGTGSRTRRERVALARRAAAAGLPTVPGYQVLEELGKGGMGVVYKARDLKLDRPVALKMILPGRDLSPVQRERFLAEARAVARFQHPNLVQIFEIGEHDGRPYFSLELVEGGTLSRKLKSMPQPPGEAAAMLETLALAVEYAHQKGIVHRDLKPANVLLAAKGTPKITDFGLAKELDQESGRTLEGGILGTPSYMAPEQAWGRTSEVGAAADVYALGAILYEMLTGRPPFQAAEKSVTVRMVRLLEPVPPRRLVPQVPRDLELICLRCLEKEPHLRFPSAGELAEELRRFQEARPILTRPAPTWERAWKWARRRPAVASLVAVSVFALLSLVLYLDQRARVADRERQEQWDTVELRDKVQLLHFRAERAADREQLQQAQADAQAALALIHSRPAALRDLEPPLAALRAELGRKEAEQAGRKAADARCRKFFELRDEALFHGMVFTGVDLPVNVAATTKACREALALFGVTPDGSQGPVFTNSVSPEQRQEVTAACYELLLVWADAVAQPGTDAVPVAGGSAAGLMASPLGAGTCAAACGLVSGLRQPNDSQLKEALGLLERARRLPFVGTGAYHVRRARYLAQMGNKEGAARERQQAAASRPEGALDHFLTADSHQKQGRLAEAAQEFGKALRAQPDHFWARYFLAVCNLQLQQPEQARDNLTACLMARKDFFWLYLFRGFANGLRNDYAAAEEDYRQALALKPDPQAIYGILVNQGVLCLRQGRTADKLVPLPWPFPLQPDLSFTCLGIAQVRRERLLAEAAGTLEKAAELQPDQYPAHRYLALVYQDQRRLARAEEALGRALAASRHREPSVRAQLYGQRARLRRERQQPEAALRDLDQALQTAPSPEDHVERGRTLYALRRYKEAAAAYDTALQLRPDDTDVYRASAEALLADRRDGEAAAALEHYLARGGRPTAQLHRTLGLIRARLRQFPEALSNYTRALELQEDSATYAARGWLFLANEGTALARSDFEAALRLDPHNADAYNGRGLVLARQGQFVEAVTDVDAALLHAGAKPSPRLLWNSAHVCCQVVAFLNGDPAGQGLKGREVRLRCQQRALELLGDSLRQVPEGERPEFWRQYVAPDTFLDPLRGSPAFEELERAYGKKTGRPSES